MEIDVVDYLSLVVEYLGIPVKIYLLKLLSTASALLLGIGSCMRPLATNVCGHTLRGYETLSSIGGVRGDVRSRERIEIEVMDDTLFGAATDTR